jgi:hypothetical protein
MSYETGFFGQKTNAHCKTRSIQTGFVWIEKAPRTFKEIDLRTWRLAFLVRVYSSHSHLETDLSEDVADTYVPFGNPGDVADTYIPFGNPEDVPHS